MTTRQASMVLVAWAVAGVAWAQSPATAQKQQELKAMEKSGQRNDMAPMTATEQAQYQAAYKAAMAKWTGMTPGEKSATVASARARKLSELSHLELVGQRDDMKRETAAQSAQVKAESDAAKAKWDKLSPAEKQAARKSAWTKKRSELNATEAVGQRDDSYVLPF